MAVIWILRWHGITQTETLIRRSMQPGVRLQQLETDVIKRNELIRKALVRTRDEVLTIPLHHQIRLWVMKTGVNTVHRSDDRPEARFTTLR